MTDSEFMDSVIERLDTIIRLLGPESGDRIFTAQELSEYLDVPLGTVYQWSSRGGGPKLYKVGRHLRAKGSDVELWLQGNNKETP